MVDPLSSSEKSGRGRAQRESVTVIFRIFDAVSKGEVEVARRLLAKAQSLDSAGVNAELLGALSECLDSGFSESSKDRITRIASGTPYEEAARAVAGSS